MLTFSNLYSGSKLDRKYPSSNDHLVSGSNLWFTLSASQNSVYSFPHCFSLHTGYITAHRLSPYRASNGVASHGVRAPLDFQQFHF